MKNADSSSINVKYDKYIPKTEVSQLVISWKSRLLTIVLFLLSGCPNSFNLKDSIYLELALFEISQPEGLELASWLQLMEALGGLCFLFILWLESHMLWPKRFILYSISSLTVLMSLMLAVTWNLTMHGSSLFLLMGMLVGSLIGWVQYTLVIPWILRNYNTKMLTPFIAGNGLMVYILVVIEITQQPGGSQKFSPTVYYLIALIIYVSTFGVCVYTFESGIERLTPKEGVKTLEPWQTSVYLQFFPDGWRETWWLIFIRVWEDSLTWSVAPIALPFAAANTSDSSTNEGVNFLEWATTIGLLAMLLGYMCSYLATEKFWIFETAVGLTVANGIILLAAANVGDWTSWLMRALLMIAVGLSKMAFAWTIPLIFRAIERKFPEKSEVLVRSNSLWALLASVFVKTTLWMLSSGVIY